MPKEKICGIYKITNPKNKVYIGQSIDILRRWNYHYKKLHCVAQKRLYASLKKYGYEKHKFEILCECTPLELNDMEKYYVDLFQTFNSIMGMNLRDGGGSRGALSDETKNKIRILKKGSVNSEETRKKISIANTGRKQSMEEISKRTEKMIGQKRSDESRKNMSVAQKGLGIGRKHSEETKEKIRNSHIGKKHSEEHILNNSISRSRKIKCNCDYCGKEKLEKPSVYNSKEHHFCCKKCYSMWSSENLIGINSRSYKHGKRCGIFKSKKSIA